MTPPPGLSVDDPAPRLSSLVTHKDCVRFHRFGWSDAPDSLWPHRFSGRQHL